LKRRSLVDLGQAVFPEPQGDILGMGHRLNPIGITVLHLGHQLKNIGQSLLIAGQFIRSDPDPSEVSDMLDVFFRDGHREFNTQE